MVANNRQDEANKIFETIITNQPEIKEALEIFSLGQNEYIAALSSLTQTEIVCSDRTYFGGNDHGQMVGN